MIQVGFILHKWYGFLRMASKIKKLFALDKIFLFYARYYLFCFRSWIAYTRQSNIHISHQSMNSFLRKTLMVSPRMTMQVRRMNKIKCIPSSLNWKGTASSHGLKLWTSHNFVKINNNKRFAWHIKRTHTATPQKC